MLTLVTPTVGLLGVSDPVNAAEEGRGNTQTKMRTRRIGEQKFRTFVRPKAMSWFVKVPFIY